MKLDNFLISFVIFSIFVVTGALILEDVNTNYNADIDTSDFNNTFDSIDEMYNLSTDIATPVLENELSDTEAWESSVKGSYSAVRLVKGTFGFFTNIIDDIANVIGIPSYFITAAITIMTILVIFAMIYLFMRV